MDPNVRLTCISGEPGIGKNYIAQAAIWYLNSRPPYSELKVANVNDENFMNSLARKAASNDKK